MTKEVPLQHSFDGELKDNRTSTQKQTARRANGWQQSPMFSQREVAQFGVRARPQMSAIGRNGKPLRMVLEMEDPRTEEERELAQQRAAEEMTYSLFGADAKLDTVQSGGRGVAELEDQLLVLQEKRRELLELLKEVLELEATTIEELKGRDGTTRPLRLPEEMGETHHIFGPGTHWQRSSQIFPMPSDKDW